MLYDQDGETFLTKYVGKALKAEDGFDSEHLPKPEKVEYYDRVVGTALSNMNIYIAEAFMMALLDEDDMTIEAAMEDEIYMEQFRVKSAAMLESYFRGLTLYMGSQALISLANSALDAAEATYETDLKASDLWTERALWVTGLVSEIEVEMGRMVK